MSTATIERTAETITAAAPLTEQETNALIALAASTEKVARVKGGRGTRTSRAWAPSGDVD